MCPLEPRLFLLTLSRARDAIGQWFACDRMPIRMRAAWPRALLFGLLSGLLLGLIPGLSSISSASTDVPQPAKAWATVQYCVGDEQPLTLEQAKQCDYGGYADLPMTARYGAVLWARVQAHTAQTQQTLTIGVTPHLMREVEIFEALSDQQGDQRIAGPVGTAHPFSDAHGLLAGYTFAFDMPARTTRTFYVRMATFGLPYGYVEAAFDAASTEQIHQRIGLGIHLGVLGLLTLISLSRYAATRSRVMGVFALNIMNLLLSVMLGSGLLYMHLWPESPELNELLFITMFYIKPALWVLLAQTFLAQYDTPRWYHPSCRFAYVIVGCMLLLAWLDMGSISIWLMLVFGATVFPVAQLVAIAKTAGMRPFYQRVLMAGYGFGALTIWIALLISLYPSNHPNLPIQLTRILDYINPVVLLALVIFNYRETLMQLEHAKQENMAMHLGLAFEQRIKEERKLMIDMLTHELKNPLASISLAIGSLSRTFKDDNNLVARRLQNIDQSVRSMDAVIERCNLMNQLDQSTLTYQQQTVNLKPVMMAVIDRFSGSSRVVLDADGVETFATDPQFFQMIASNLIDNALKYSPAGSEVQVSLARQGAEANGALVIEVANEVGNKGAPDPGLVFTRFYRHPLAQETSGSGVGLYLVEALIKLMGGQIEYLPSTDQVMFRVTLPESNNHA